MSFLKEILIIVSCTALVAGASAVVKVNVLEAKYESQREILLEIKADLCDLKKMLMTRR